jgi:Cd2+/Zn2+-exporting ATPase
MEQKVYYLKNLDCANCAAKIEAKFNALPEVESATITFATRQLHLTAEDPDALLEKLTQIARTVEGEVEIHTHAHHEHHDHCHCHDCHDHDHRHEEKESTLGILIGAGLFVVGLLFGSIPVVSILLFVAAYLILGWKVLTTAAKNLVKGHVFDENFLMSIATLGAFAIREFPEAVGVMLFYRVGEFFEHRAVEKSRKEIMDAVDLRPETVQRIEKDAVVTIAAADAKVGDLLLVRPGDRIPLDGVVVNGESRIDTAPITGESVPVSVRPGDAVISGCVNTTGQLTVRVAQTLQNSMVTRILESVEHAAAGKPKIDRFITRFAKIYTPIVVGIAAFVAFVPSLLTGDWNYWVYTALSFLVMSCPCALVLSVPLAYFCGIGVGSQQGILFKSGLTIEALASVKAVVMDKTGTVTKGDFSVQEVVGGEDVLTLCAICEQYSTHPIALSILAAAKQPLPTPESTEEIAGHGIRATVGGKQILCGNQKWMAVHKITVPEASETRVYVAESGKLLGWIVLGDSIKEDAPDAIRDLKHMGITTAILTGDEATTAQKVGAQLGIDEVHARLLPHEKLSVLQQIRQEVGSVMFVGDGINDAPVLSGSDVGAAMGSGADAAIEAADVVFMHSRVSAIPASLRIARRTQKTAKRIISFALVVKLAVMVLGILGYASMWAAVFADSGVAALCVAYAISPLYLKKSTKK